jgi:hypothetical protein
MPASRRAVLGALIAALVLGGAGGEAPGARYDRLFAAHDYGTLATELKQGVESKDTAPSTLAWEQQRFAAGSSVFVGALYALQLAGAAAETKDAAALAKIRANAATVALYTMAAIETDGVKCAAPAAQAARRRQFVQLLTPVWIELRKLPDDAVAAALGQALGAEKALAPARAPDDYLCRGLTADIPELVAADAKAVAPHFLAPADWTPRAAAVRAKLPALMTEFAVRVKSGS